MEVLGWVIAGILAITTIVFLWLWVQARLKQRAVEETMQDVQQAVGASGPGARGVTNGNFDQDVIYNLLAKGQLNVQGKMHNFGVVGADGHAPQPFLSTVNMTHLVAGDSFSSIRGSLHKVDTGGAAQSAAPAAAPPAARPRCSTCYARRPGTRRGGGCGGPNHHVCTDPWRFRRRTG